MKKPTNWNKILLICGTGLLLYLLYAITVTLFDDLNKARIAQSSQDSQKSVTLTPRVLDIQKMYPLINEERVKAGLHPLAVNVLLEKSACMKTDDLIERNYWAHVAPDGTQPWYFFEKVGYRYTKAGENLAYGFMDEKETVDGWMKSPGHKANILGNFTEMGLCSRVGPEYQGRINNVSVNHFGVPK